MTALLPPSAHKASWWHLSLQNTRGLFCSCCQPAPCGLFLEACGFLHSCSRHGACQPSAPCCTWGSALVRGRVPAPCQSHEYLGPHDSEPAGKIVVCCLATT